MIIGLLQFVSTFLITTLYVRYAERRIDPSPSTSAPASRDPRSDRSRPGAGDRGQPLAQHRDLPRVRGDHARVRLPGQPHQPQHQRLLRGGPGVTGTQNGVAIAGDYLSAASFLGIAGAIALAGYDGFLYSIGFLVAWLVALLLVAELLRNTGKFTMGDVLAFRMRQRPVRAAAATSTLVVSFFYLLAQMAGAGGLIALLLQIPASNALGQGVVIAVVGSS